MRSERWRYHSMLNCDSIYRDRSLNLSIDLFYLSIYPLAFFLFYCLSVILDAA